MGSNPDPRVGSGSTGNALAAGTSGAGAKGLIACLRSLFAAKGIPDILSSDGGTKFTAGETQAFLKTWGVTHRLSSAHYPQSNGRAKVAVKSVKRLLRDHCTPSGKLDTDAYMMGIMAHHNTPDLASGLSPAQVVYDRPLLDAFRFMSDINKFSDQRVQGLWREAWALKERANRHRFYSQREAKNAHARELVMLNVGAKVFVQNQHGNHPTKWDRTGTIVEIVPNSSFQVHIDGSGRLAKRTRQHLRKFKPLDAPPR